MNDARCQDTYPIRMNEIEVFWVDKRSIGNIPNSFVSVMFAQ